MQNNAQFSNFFLGGGCFVVFVFKDIINLWIWVVAGNKGQRLNKKLSEMLTFVKKRMLSVPK